MDREEQSGTDLATSAPDENTRVPRETIPGARGYNLMHFLGFNMEFSATEATGRFVVTENSCQPYGVLHGGVTACIAESIASAAGGLIAKQRVAGIELNVSHLRAVPLGSSVTVTAKPMRTGRRVQVWEVQFHADKLESSKSELSGGPTEQYLAAVARVSLIVGGPPEKSSTT